MKLRVTLVGVMKQNPHSFPPLMKKLLCLLRAAPREETLGRQNRRLLDFLPRDFRVEFPSRHIVHRYLVSLWRSAEGQELLQA